ncbi:MAG: hypothetical protein KF729_06380 [Sandaracinaceae bacterium]|nr:hypothetical protein [Sandaracinaceae bacterium]
MADWHLVYEDETLREAYARNVHLVAWFDAPTADHMRQYGVGAQALHARYPRGSALVNLIVSGTPSFSNEVRELARQYTAEGLHDAGAAHVILVGGLLGSAVRGFLGTMVLLGRPPNPTRVFAAIEPAAAWLTRNLAQTGPEPWDAAELAELTARFLER